MKKGKLEINLEDLKVNNEAAYFLHQASSWARFLAIAGFIFYGLIILFALIAAISASGGNGAFTHNMPMYKDMAHPVFTWGTFFFMIVIMGIATIPLFFLYGFSDKAKKAIMGNDSAMLTQSIHSLKNLFVFYGIVIIVYIVLIFIGILIGGIATHFMGM